MQAAVFATKNDSSPWGAPASLLVHGLLLVALLLSPAAPRMILPPEASVAVDILTPRQFQAAVDPAPEPITAPESAALPPPVPDAAPEPSQGMVVARTMLSGKTLADPRSRQAVRDLATFADSERVFQLCNLEAMDQVEAWRSDFQPDRVVAYARSEVSMSGETIVADGAAFRSRKRWYDIKFKCEVAPDHARVVAFQFQVGDPVPRKDWEKLNLPPVY